MLSAKSLRWTPVRHDLKTIQFSYIFAETIDRIFYFGQTMVTKRIQRRFASGVRLQNIESTEESTYNRTGSDSVVTGRRSLLDQLRRVSSLESTGAVLLLAGTRVRQLLLSSRLPSPCVRALHSGAISLSGHISVHLPCLASASMQKRRAGAKWDPTKIFNPRD